jgi:hypothetical protein
MLLIEMFFPKEEVVLVKLVILPVVVLDVLQLLLDHLHLNLPLPSVILVPMGSVMSPLIIMIVCSIKVPPINYQVFTWAPVVATALWDSSAIIINLHPTDMANNPAIMPVIMAAIMAAIMVGMVAIMVGMVGLVGVVGMGLEDVPHVKLILAM